MVSREYIFCLGGQENTLALARYGSMLGVKVVYLDYEETPASFSRYVQFQKLERTTEKGILEQVLRMKHSIGADKPFIFFNSDNFVRFAFHHRPALAGEFDFIIPAQKIIDCALDKGKMNQILPEEVLPISFPVEGVDDLLRLIPPLMVKARDTSKQRTFKTLVLESRMHCGSFAQNNDGQLKDFLFQEVVKEVGGRLVSVFFYRDHEGRFCSVAMERERMNPYWGGVGCLIKVIRFEFIDLIREMFREMGYVGLGEIDLFESKGKITIFDLNVRLPSWAFLAKIAGVDLIGMYLRDLSGGAFNVIQRKKNNSKRCIKAIDLINDVEAVFHPRKGLFFKRMITLREYVKSVRSVRYFFIFNLVDFRPFFHKMIMEFANAFRKKRA